MSTPADIAIYGGGAGGGKTWSLLVEPLRHINNSRFGAVIFRATFPMITMEGGLWDESVEIYPHLGAMPKVSNVEWQFKQGSSIKFAHIGSEKEKLNWQGAQIALIEFDQLEHFTEGIFFYMLSRNRSKCGVRPYVRATCNPDVDSWIAKFIEWWINQETGYPILERCGVLRWFYQVDDQIKWYDTKEQAEGENPDLALLAPPKSVTYINATIDDNPTLMQKDPGYLANLMALSKIDRERLLKSNWKIRAEAGNVFNRAWFGIVEASPAIGRRIRYWDKAGTEGAGCRTAGVLMLKTENNMFYVEDCIYGQWSALNREKAIKQTAQLDGEDVEVYHEQEPGSGGKESAENTTRQLAGYQVHADKVTGDKVTRALPYAAQCEAGNVKLVFGLWNRQFIDDHHGFPDIALKDIVDAASGAFNKLLAIGPPAASYSHDPEPILQRRRW